MRGSRPRKMLSATVSSGTRLSSWWMMAMPAASAWRTLAKRTGRPSTSSLAVVVGVDAGQDLHQRRLAGAVLAHQRVDLAGAELETDRVERRDAAETLADTASPQAADVTGSAAAGARRMDVMTMRPPFHVASRRSDANRNVSMLSMRRADVLCCDTAAAVSLLFWRMFVGKCGKFQNVSEMDEDQAQAGRLRAPTMHRRGGGGRRLRSRPFRRLSTAPPTSARS